jgi:glycosyltransferase involved in cell wall biosynthesis
MNRPLRILLVADFFEPFIGGAELHVKTLASELARRGHEVTVATVQLPGTEAAESIDGFRVKRLVGWSGRVLSGFYERKEAPFHPPVPDPGIVAALKSIIDEVRPHIVNAQGWIAYSCLSIFRHKRFRLVVTLHDHSLVCVRRTLMRNEHQPCSGPQFNVCLRCAIDNYGRAKGTMLVLGHRAAAPLHQRADSWIAVSRFVAARSRDWIPSDQVIKVIPPASPQPPPLGKRLPWLPAGGYLLFVGALGPHKGLNWVLDAYSDAKIRLPLVIIGAPRHDTPKTWPAGVVVKMNVPHQQVMEAWRHAEIGLVTSLCPEGFGLVAVESMRSGTPVVATRIGALPEIVDDGITGLLVAPGNTMELQAAIRRLDKDPRLRESMGRAGLAKARQFDARVVTTLYEEQYRHLLAGRSRPNRTLDTASGVELV